MQIVENAALHFTAPANLVDQLYQVVEKSEITAQAGHFKDLVMFWGHEEVCRATALTDQYKPTTYVPKLPSPILRDYSWPGIYKPFDHQKETAAFLSVRPRAFCFNEAGTGKTSAAIWAADYLMTIGHIKKVLIICPLSIMYSAWQADVLRTAMHRTCSVAYGPAAKRKKIIAEDYHFTIINYDGTEVVFNELLAASYDLIIVDEANAYKATKTKRWKTLAKLLTPTTWLWMMTGTPAAQSPVDAFGLARLVSPNRVPKYTTAWRDTVMTQISRFTWVPKATHKQSVFEALQPAIRYTKQECLDLPPITYQTRHVPLSAQAERFYKELKTQLLVETAGQSVSSVNAAAGLSKLLQVSGGAVYTDAHRVLEFDVNPRLRELKSVLDETTNKVVVFVPYIHTIAIVARYLESEGFTNEIIQGSVPAKTRSEIIDRFQTQENPRVLIIQPQSAAHGITLTAADTIVFWSPVMSVETYLQCIGRIERVGQQNKMTVVQLEGSSVERRMYRALQDKVDTHQQIVDLYKQEIEEV
jgi:SNF2 family DNA or RNA helicase